MATNRDVTDALRRLPPADRDTLVADWESSATKDRIAETILSNRGPQEVVSPVRSRPRRHLVAAAVVAAATVGAVLIIGPGGSTTAIAGWTPASGSSEEARTAFLEHCQEQRGFSNQQDTGLPEVMREFAADPGDPSVVDVRGNAGVAVWHGQGSDGSVLTLDCTAVDADWDGTFDHGGASASMGGAASGPEGLSRGADSSQGSRIETVSGRVDQNVARVVIERDDGVEVEATLGRDGVFLAWWPGRHGVTEIVLFDEDGNLADRWHSEDWEIPVG